MVGKENELKVSRHRRASFQRTALRDLRINQKNNFHILKEAALKAKQHFGSSHENERSQTQQDEPQSHPQHEAATKIQAAFRGYSNRQYLFCMVRPKKSNRCHRRLCSEITMSDFNDSFHSLGSLELSPETKHHNASHSTAETWPVFDGHDSFTSIFSTESLDLPARLPSRKLSPRKQSPRKPLLPPSTPSRLDKTSALKCIEELQEKLSIPDMTLNSSFDSSMPELHHRSSSCLRRSEDCHGSFSSFFSKDEPVQRPERSRSPLLPRTERWQ